MASTADVANIASAYRQGFWQIPKAQYLPVEDFENHELVKKLVDEDPAVQIEFFRQVMGGEVSRCGATGAKPIRVLKDSDRSSRRKMEAYRHFRNLYDDKFYPMGSALALGVVLRRDLPVTHDDLVYVTNQLADLRMVVLSCNIYVPGLVRHLKNHIESKGTTLELQKAVKRLASAMDVPDQPEDHQALYGQVKTLAAAKASRSKPTTASSGLSRAEIETQAGAWLERLLQLERSEDLLRHKEVLGFLQADPAVHVAMVRMTADRIGKVREEFDPFIPQLKWDDPDYQAKHKAHNKCTELRGVKGFPGTPVDVLERLLVRKLPFTADDLTFILHRLADLEYLSIQIHRYLRGVLRQLQKYAESNSITPELATQMERLAKAMDWPAEGSAEQRRAIAMLRDMAALAG